MSESSIIKPIILLTFLLSALPAGLAQQSAILDGYIREGLKNNLALQQKEFNLEKCLKALKEANGLFMPSATLESQYMVASGGRSVELPVGDMLNPVYNTLNELLASHGLQAEFPHISNQNIPFLPDDFYDTKVRVITPLINAEIYYNRKINKENIRAVQAENNVYRRELLMNIKISYYRYLQSLAVVQAYNSALQLTNEAHRVNQKLIENQMAGPEKLYRIEAEQSQVKAQLAKARNEAESASDWFNFLINRDAGTVILCDSLIMPGQIALKPFTDDVPRANPEEIDQLESSLLSARYYYRLKKAYALPVVTNITDIGYQGYGLTFAHDDQYFMNTLQISIPLFNGFQNRQKSAQVKISTEILNNKLEEVTRQIALREKIAEGNYQSAVVSEEANKLAWISSKEYYKVVSRQYATGQKSLLDILDARNQLTNSEIGYQIAHFETYIRYAELERALAAINLELLMKE